MGNKNAACCASDMQYSDNDLDGPVMVPQAKRRSQRYRSRGKSVERRNPRHSRRGRSPQRRKSSKSRSIPVHMAQQSLPIPLPQRQTTRNVENPTRSSYDMQSHGGSFYRDPRSHSSAGSGLDKYTSGVSSPYMRDLYYMTSTSPPVGRGPINSGGRRPTSSHHVVSRGSTIDEDRYWRESKTEAISYGNNSMRPVYHSHAAPIQEKEYNWGPSHGSKYLDGWQQNRKTSHLITPDRQSAFTGTRAQKNYGDVRIANIQRYQTVSSPIKSGYIDPQEARKSRTTSFVQPSNVRQRRNAIKVDTYEKPSGLFKGDRRYIMFGSGLWETVTVDNWNHWSGTWQVIDSGGRSFQAAPLALKTEEEYRFLSKDRTCGHRSFASSIGSYA